MAKSNWEDSSSKSSFISKDHFKALLEQEKGVSKVRIVNEEIYYKKRKQLREQALKQDHTELLRLEKAKEEALQKEHDIRTSLSDNATQKEFDKLEDATNARIKAEERVYQYKSDNISDLAELEKNLNETAAKEAFKIEDLYYKTLSAADKRQFVDRKVNNQKLSLEKLKDEQKLVEAERKAFDEKMANGEKLTEEDRKRYNELADIHKENRQSIEGINQSLIDNENERIKLNEILLDAQLSYLSTKEKTAAVEKIISEEEERQKELREEQAELGAQANSLDNNSKEWAELQKKISDLDDELAKSSDRIEKANNRLADTIRESAEVNAEENGKRLTQDRDIANANKKESLEARKAALKTKEGREALVEEGQLAAEEKKVQEEEDKIRNAAQANAEFGDNMKKNLKEAFGGKSLLRALDNLAKSIDNNISSMYEYQGYIAARLQGSDIEAAKAIKKVSDNIGFSGIVSQKEVVAKIKEAVDHGIAYNVEMRAFLASTAENIANTFDVFDSNLLRLIRLQQADSTAARMGMEATLTKLFNSTFSDTSYLSDAADIVAGAILDASAQLTKENSLQFEYIVQKWLGALYSVGLSESAVSTIAEGINYLGTGNVEALNSNESLQTLMAMSASQAGISYAEILTEGLDPSNTNKLLKSMIEYLKSIATNTDNNQVTKQAYTNLFGISMADLTAINNLQTADIETLYKNTTTYGDNLNEINNQLSSIATRIHMSKLVDTAFENIMVDVATNIGSTAIGYGIWKSLNTIEGLTGGIPIPAFSVMGNMVDLSSFTIEGIAKSGIAGISLLGSIISGLSSGNLFGTTDLNAWGKLDGIITRGSSKGIVSSGMASGTSESANLIGSGNASGEDVKTTSMSDQTDQANKDKDITNKDVEGIGQTELQNIRDAVWKSEKENVLLTLLDIRSRMDAPFITYGGGGGGASGGSVTSTSPGSTTSGISSTATPAGAGITIPDLEALFNATTFKISGGGSGGGGASGGLSVADLEALYAKTTFKTTGPSAADIQNLSNSSIFKVEVLSITTTGGSSSSSIVGGSSSSSSTSLTGPGMTTIIDSSSLLTPLNSILDLLDLNRVFKSSIETIAPGSSVIATIQSATSTTTGGTTSSAITNLSNQVNSSNPSINSSSSSTSTSNTSVTLDTLSSNFSTEFQKLIYNAVLHAMSTHHTNINTDVQAALLAIINDALANSTVDTHITNDYFDTVMQKQAFSTP